MPKFVERILYVEHKETFEQGVCNGFIVSGYMLVAFNREDTRFVKTSLLKVTRAN